MGMQIYKLIIVAVSHWDLPWVPRCGGDGVLRVSAEDRGPEQISERWNTATISRGGITFAEARQQATLHPGNFP